MGNRSVRLIWIAALSATLAVSMQAQSAQTAAPMTSVNVQLKDTQGKSVGTATVQQLRRGVEVKLTVNGLAPGEHAVHFHQNAKCDPPDFQSAGPHFNPANKEHGLQNPKGYHAGDMPNFTVQPNGAADTTVMNDAVVVGSGTEANSLLANGGTALVIHAKPDDMKTDPAGNAGDRIACGIISK